MTSTRISSGRLEAERRRVADVELEDAVALVLEPLGLLEHRAADVVTDVGQLARLQQCPPGPRWHSAGPTRCDSTTCAVRLASAWSLADVVRQRRMVRTYDPDRPVPRGHGGAPAQARGSGAVGRAIPRAGISSSWTTLTTARRFWAVTATGEPDPWLARMRTAPVLVHRLLGQGPPISTATPSRTRAGPTGTRRAGRCRTGTSTPAMAAMIVLLAAVDAGLGGVLLRRARRSAGRPSARPSECRPGCDRSASSASATPRRTCARRRCGAAADRSRKW